MPTLVKCLTYNEGINSLLQGARQKTDFRVNAPPFEVLKQTIHNYFIESYLETHPWMVTLKSGRDYLSISEIDNSMRLHGDLNDFLSCQDFSSTRREHRLTSEESENLAKNILKTLSIDNYPGMMVSRSYYADIAYSEVLSALGHNLSPKQVSEMITAQQLKWNNEITAERIKRAEDGVFI